MGFISYNGHLEVHSSLLGVVLAEQSRSVEADTNPWAVSSSPRRQSGKLRDS
jgi:hypothetical protein